MRTDHALNRTTSGASAKPTQPRNAGSPSSIHRLRGFSLLELLAVILVIGVLAGLLLSALAKAKSQARSVACLNNLKNLQAAWLMYVHSYGDSLPPNISRKVGGFDQVSMAVGGRVPWVLGNAKIDTNAANIQGGVLFPHVGSATVYHCPSDKSTVRGRPELLRTRSYSMVSYLNCDVVSGTILDTVNDYRGNLRKYSGIVNGNPGPSRTWVFIDEHERSIDDGIFAIPSQFGSDQSGMPSNFWDSFPGDRHNNGANLSFADGHVEHHTWRFHRVKIGPGIVVAPDPLDLADLRWLQDRLPRTP
jgi:prepilin-type processing-associated H-X9-DG protein/prepilin-type N-terminal cleavage/methylation domain-containing protein